MNYEFYYCCYYYCYYYSCYYYSCYYYCYCCCYYCFIASSVDITTASGNSIHVTMLPNPSHLEAINPVAMGKARARMLSQQTGPYSEGQNEQSKVCRIIVRHKIIPTICEEYLS